MKLKYKIFLKALFHSILQFSLIFAFAWFYGHFFEMIIIYCCFFFFRTKFDKQYHATRIWLCTLYTIVIFYVISIIAPSKGISIILIILFTFLINTISYYVRDYLDIRNKKKLKNKRQIIIDILGSDNLDEESIEKYCTKIGFPNLSESIYLFINNKLEDVADILGVDNSTITRRVNKFIQISKTR